MFARFFKPKWQHKDPIKRRQAAIELAQDDPALLTLAQEDESPEVRSTAVSRLLDAQVLSQIVVKERNNEVLQKARSRLQDLICGEVEEAPPLSERIHILDQVDSNGLLEHIARHGNEAELRRRGVMSIHNPEVLAEIGLSDRSVEVRTSAIERIDNISALERIVKATKKSDKRVTQLARQRLTTLRRRREKNQQLSKLCDTIETLCQKGTYAARQSALLKADREWSQVSEVVDVALKKRYIEAFPRLVELCDRYRNIKTSKQKACHLLEELANALRQEEELSDELEQRMQATLAKANECWNIEGKLEDADEKLLSQRYRRFAEAIIERQTWLHENALAAQRVREFFKKMENAMQTGEFSTKQSVARLRDAWEKLPKPNSRPLFQELSSQFKKLYERAEQQIAKAAEHARQTEELLMELTVQLHQSVQEGQLNEAISLRDQIRYRLENVGGIAIGKRKKFEQALKNTAPKIRELQSWRTWGAGGVRERLCEQAEGLIESEQSPHELAKTIRELRVAWKRLDHQSGAPANDALWERFNIACNRAYEPCRKAFDEEAKQREQNLQRKLELSRKLETLGSETNWDQVDWRALVKTYNNLLQSWRQTGPISRSKRKSIEKQFKKATREIESRLEKQRQIGLRYRRQLIEQVESLSEETDLNKAIEQAKKAQKNWDTVVVRATQKDENALWKEFRTACDKVFERRDAEQQVRQQALVDNAKEKSKLCEELESLTQNLIQDNIEDTVHRVERLEQTWGEVGDAPKEDHARLQKRFKENLNAFRQTIVKQQRLQAQRLWSALQEHAQLCMQLEAQLEHHSGPYDLDKTKSAWEMLPKLDEHQVQEVTTRFEAGLSALQGNLQQRESLTKQLHDAAEEKRAQCLEMELLAGVESPPEFAEQRMQLKVTQLSERFEGQNNAGTRAPYEIALEAQRTWISSGMLPADEMQALEGRFAAAAKVLLDM